MNLAGTLPSCIKRTPILLCAILLLACSCAHKTQNHSAQISKDDWKYQFIRYRDTLPSEYPDSAENVLVINEQMRAELNTRFGHLKREEAVYALAQWLIHEDGLGLTYNVDANLRPIDAYEQRLGNCLSYSLLFTQLAKELGIKVAVNSVDIPETWGIDNDKLLFYRHVNVVYKAPGKKHILDFTPGAYDARYPQKALTEAEALSLFYNNRALDHYRVNNYQRATHFIKLSASFNPDNPDVWSNTSAILKANKALTKAKEALLFALRLDPDHVVAASQIERLYREEGDIENANKYLAIATKARNNNPYYLFRKAKTKFLEQNYLKAQELVTGAIKKHRYDSRFFALRGTIENKLENYKAAQRSFKKASALEVDLQQKQDYSSKALLLGKLARGSKKQSDSAKVNLEVKSL